jgi:acetoin utilization protein AcuB
VNAANLSGERTFCVIVRGKTIARESHTMKTVRDYMTPAPKTIDAEECLAAAHQRMRAFNVRHLPVISGGKLVGVVTARDMQILETHSAVGARTTDVREAMTPAPFCVRPDASLEEVVRTMAMHKYGSAIVTSNEGEVVGIFTSADALRALAETLHDLQPPTSNRWGHVVG